VNISSFFLRGAKRKRLLVLLAGAGVLGVGVYLLHDFQVARSADALASQVDQEERDEQHERAAELLSRYLDLRPEDSDARARYGSLLGKLARTPEERMRAFRLLEEVLSQGEDRPHVRREAVRLAMTSGWFPDAARHLRLLLQSSPQDIALMRLYAQCLAGMGKSDKAAPWYAQAVEQAPRDAELSEAYAMLLRERFGQPAQADAVIERLLLADRRSAKARLVAARYYLRYGSEERAGREVHFALTELQGRDAELLLVAADLAMLRGDGAEARMLLREVQRQRPADARAALGLARLEARDGRREQALRTLQPVLRQLPESPEELWVLANLVIDCGAEDRAGPAIERLEGQGPAAVGSYLRARLLTCKGRWGEARVLLERSRTAGLPSRELGRLTHLLLAECHGWLGNFDQQVSCCRQALEFEPTWLPARRKLAAALADLGNTEQAIAEYRKLLPQAPELRPSLAQLLLASLPVRPGLAPGLVALSETGQALADYRKLLPQAPKVRGKLVALLVRYNLSLPEDERRWTEVERLLQAPTEGDQPAGRAQLLWAEVLLAQGKLQDARRLVELERDRDRKQVPPWLFLIRLARRQGTAGSVLPLVEEAERQAGKRVEWELARAHYWANADNAEALKQLPKLEAGIGTWPDAERDRLLEALAGSYYAAGDSASAVRLWGQLAERQPNNLYVRLSLLESAVEDGRRVAAERALAEVERVEGKGGPATAYGQASVHILRARQGDKGMLAEAHRLLTEAAAGRPSWSLVPLREAQAYELEGRKDRALEKYQAALERGASGLPVYRRAVQLLYEQGRYAEARALVGRLPQQALAERDLGRLAAQLALVGVEARDDQDPAQAGRRALELARRTVPADSKLYHDYLWLGTLAWAAGQPQEAEKALRRARDLADTVPDTWAALILLLARTEPRRAEADLAAARRKLAAAQALLPLALCEEALGHTKEAEERYRAALATRPNDPLVVRAMVSFYGRLGQSAKAEPLLQKLLDPATQAPAATAAWARRELARALAARHDYRQFQKALALLGNGIDGPEAAEDQLTRAQVLATQPAHRREALRLFEGWANRQPTLPPEVRLAMAELYTAAGDWPRARRHLLALVSSYTDNPVYLARYVRGLLSAGELEMAEVWLRRLARTGGPAFELAELRARVYHARGDAGSAVRLLRAYAREKDARPELAAQLLDQLGQPAEAEQTYRAHAAASTQPESVLPLAVHLARHGRLPEALDLCEQAWPRCPVEKVATASVEALRLGQGGADQQQRVLRWLTAAGDRAPRSVVLLCLQAELHGLCGHAELAEAAYRKVLELEPHHPLALNNLAYSLTLRKGRQAEALGLINTAIDWAGPAAALLDTRALVYLQCKQVALATNDLLAAVAQEPTATMYFHLAQAHQLAGDRPAAAHALRRASALGLTAKRLPLLERPAFTLLAREFALP
jgi:predicted Zn-dependent protease